MADSTFLRIPPEIRMVIYEHLLDTGGQPSIAIRNKPNPTAWKVATGAEQKSAADKRRRSSYHVLEKTLMRRSYQTTYWLESDVDMHPAILAVNKKIREEASHYLYAKHTFHFGGDLEAVAPFLEDRTTSTRELVQAMSLYRRGTPSYMEADAYDWASACRALSTLPRLKKLTVVVGGGRPRRDWDGPSQLAVSDLRLLYATKHECMEWVRELAALRTVDEVEIVADIQFMTAPTTTATLIFAALSASIETTLVEFLRTELDIPVKVGHIGPEGLVAAQGGCVAS